MIKKIIEGFFFGTGFTLAFVIIYTLWTSWAYPVYVEHRLSQFIVGQMATEHSEQKPELNIAPQIKNNDQFLGGTTAYIGDFETYNTKTLASGKGSIEGIVLANGQPVEGLKLRLALNGSAWSQWAISDNQGKYNVSVPQGDYSIDGFEIDRQTANQVLAGTIHSPRFTRLGVRASTDERTPGKGITLRYVDPVKLIAPKGEITLIEPIIAEWEAYPEAESYQLQVYEKENLDDVFYQSPKFKWSERPEVLDTRIDFSEYNLEFKPGYYYMIQVTAKNNSDRPISETANFHSEHDFKIME